MAGAWQPTPLFDIAGTLQAAQQIRRGRTAEEAEQVQLSQLYRADSRQREIESALRDGDMQRYSQLDPQGFAKLQQANLDLTKTRVGIQDTQGQIVKRTSDIAADRAERTSNVRKMYASALERNPALAEQLQQEVARRSQGETPEIDYFDLPGKTLPDGEVGPVVGATLEGARDYARAAGAEIDFDKSTDELREFKRVSGIDQDDPRFGGAFEAYQRDLRLAQSGSQNPAKLATDLRKEFASLPDVKNYGILQDSLGKIRGASANGAGDIGLIFGYMKLLDPNSTVREGEFATAVASGGVPSNIAALFNKVQGAGLLDAKTRNAIRAESEKLAGAQLNRYKRNVDQYSRLARKNGIAPEDVIAFDDNTPNTGDGGEGGGFTPFVGRPGDGADERDIPFSQGGAQPARPRQYPEGKPRAGTTARPPITVTPQQQAAFLNELEGL